METETCEFCGKDYLEEKCNGCEKNCLGCGTEIDEMDARRNGVPDEQLCTVCFKHENN